MYSSLQWTIEAAMAMLLAVLESRWGG